MPVTVAPSLLSADFARLGEKDDLFKALTEIVGRHNGLWNAEAERYLLKYCKQA